MIATAHWSPSEAEVLQYGYGCCMYLAAALQERLGGHIEAVFFDESPDHLIHAWLVDTHGVAWDIDGRTIPVRLRNGYPFRLERFESSAAMWTYIHRTPEPEMVTRAAATAESMAASRRRKIVA